MTLVEIVNAVPLWLRIWWNILVLGVFVLPVLLMIWPQTRRVGAITAGVSLIVGGIVYAMFLAMGYVRLLGLPHVILWTPIAMYLFANLRRTDIPAWPRRIMWASLLVFIGTLAFDYVDVVRYGLGDRGLMVEPSS